MQKVLKAYPLILLFFFTCLMVGITIPYLSFDDQTAFLRIKQWIIHNEFWKLSFYVHVLTSCFCLLAGFTQFSKTFLVKKPHIHRAFGWLYIVAILLFSGPSGLIMSFYANGGILSQTAFATLSVLWIFFTAKSLISVKRRDYSEHQNFIIRSYALTLSAITLRAWKYLIVLFFRPHPMDAYMLVAWLGWVPNLVLAEIYIRKKLFRKSELS